MRMRTRSVTRNLTALGASTLAPQALTYAQAQGQSAQANRAGTYTAFASGAPDMSLAPVPAAYTASAAPATQSTLPTILPSVDSSSDTSDTSASSAAPAAAPGDDFSAGSWFADLDGEHLLILAAIAFGAIYLLRKL